MRRIDNCIWNTRSRAAGCCAEGVEIGRRHVATLMKRMGVEPIYRRPNTSKPAPGNKIYPYLLRGGRSSEPGLGRWTSPIVRLAPIGEAYDWK